LRSTRFSTDTPSCRRCLQKRRRPQNYRTHKANCDQTTPGAGIFPPSPRCFPKIKSFYEISGLEH
jgi:hypothetical protein